ncbi:YdcF family protein [Sphingobacterium sp. SRCM116780]|uniref:YdcF family protein n=1 Tax=Sphingobacterium sp. SRCM116780 TaxID=2907623 RepID=UPI001F1CEE37|nr:YdcF family protein [Sphingobacterium sp. SRCM116780]UIR56844.1 YdcF family protein [Sphingobacterium sp. SRCM116780]
MKRTFRIVKIILGVFMLWFLIHSIYITIDGLSDKNKHADVAIVLGNKVNEDGTLSQRLQQRLNKSIALYQQKRVKEIIVSGGIGKEGFWEGNKMKEYLLANNIPSEKISVDNYGNDTEKTVHNSIRIMDSLHYKSAISVSQYFHQTRTKKLFRKNGFKNIESASPDYFEWRDVYSIFREFVAYYKEAL